MLLMEAKGSPTQENAFERLQTKGLEAVKEKDMFRALAYFKQALLQNPHAVSVHNNLSNIYTMHYGFSHNMPKVITISADYCINKHASSKQSPTLKKPCDLIRIIGKPIIILHTVYLH